MRIMRSICFVLRTFGVLVFICVSGHAQSPCPGTFDYQNDGYEMYGVINIQPNGPASYVNVKANFTIAAQLPTNYFGSIEPINKNGLEQRLIRGDSIKYKVHFPVSSPLPLLTSIVANNKLLCHGPGDLPGPYKIVTTINLEHVLMVNTGPDTRPFLTDFVVPGTLLEIEPSYSPAITNVPGDFVDPFGSMPATVTTNRARPRPPIPVLTNPVRVETRPVVIPPVMEFAANQIDAFNPVERVDQETAIECGIPSLGVNPLILLGEEYLRGDWPWVVAIFKRKVQQLEFICSGSLISEQHVVTAAHCVSVRNLVIKTSDIVAKVGAYDLDDVSDDISKNIYIEKATPHDAYDPHSLKNDILILTLQKKVVYNNYISPVCLWNEDRIDLSLIVKKRGVVTGWGVNEYSEPGRGKPRKASIPVVSTETCKASNEDFGKLTSDTTLCAGDRNGTGPCNGDSGGGFYMKESGDRRWRLRGVVSVSLHSDDGEYICNVQQYIVFTDTAKYLPWIKSIMSMT